MLRQSDRKRIAKRILCGIAATVCVCTFAGSAHAVDFSADTALTIRARQTLWNDPKLDRLNLGVRVRNGVATLWGPVMTASEGREAVDRLRIVSGIRSVVDETYILPADDPLRGDLQPIRRMAKVETDRLTPSVTTAKNPNSSPPLVELLPPRPAYAELQDRLDELIGRERRFRGLTATVSDGQVIITGKVPHSRDLWDFGELARKVPGVRNVLLRATAD